MQASREVISKHLLLCKKDSQVMPGILGSISRTKRILDPDPIHPGWVKEVKDQDGSEFH